MQGAVCLAARRGCQRSQPSPRCVTVAQGWALGRRVSLGSVRWLPRALLLRQEDPVRCGACLQVEGTAVPGAAEFLGAAGASSAGELLPGRQMLGKRGSFIENGFTDCFGQLPRLLYRAVLPKRCERGTGSQKRRGWCGERKKRCAVLYAPVPKQGGWICPRWDSTDVSGAESQTRDV